MRAVRAENRIGTYTNAAATILGHPDVRVECHIRDISKSGMCIGVNNSIANGSIVKVEWDDHFLVGRVQRAAEERGGFVVGLELLYCSKWREPLASTLTGAPAMV